MTLAEALDTLELAHRYVPAAIARRNEAAGTAFAFCKLLRFKGFSADMVEEAVSNRVERLLERGVGRWDAERAPASDSDRERQAAQYLRTTVLRRLYDQNRGSRGEVELFDELPDDTGTDTDASGDTETAAALHSLCERALDLACRGIRSEAQAQIRESFDGVWRICAKETTLAQLATEALAGDALSGGTRDSTYERLRQRHYRTRKALCEALTVLMRRPETDLELASMLRDRLRPRDNSGPKTPRRKESP